RSAALRIFAAGDRRVDTQGSDGTAAATRGARNRGAACRRKRSGVEGRVLFQRLRRDSPAGPQLDVRLGTVSQVEVGKSSERDFGARTAALPLNRGSFARSRAIEKHPLVTAGLQHVRGKRLDKSMERLELPTQLEGMQATVGLVPADHQEVVLRRLRAAREVV